METDSPTIQVEFAPEFERQIRILYKRYRQIRSDVQIVIEQLQSVDPLPRLKPVGFRTQAEIAGKACLTSPTPTDKTLPVFAIERCSAGFRRRFVKR